MMDVLGKMLEPLAEYYEHPDHEEIAINQPKEIWCRRRRPDADGNIWVRLDDDRIDHRFLRNIMQAVANTYGQPFNPEDILKPCTVSASLAPNGHRFGGIAGQSVCWDQQLSEGGVAICIRKGTGGDAQVHRVEYADWGLVEGRGVQKGYHHVAQIADSDVDAVQALRDAITQGCNILISGGTSTGKTTLFNRILEELDEKTRIITVEDTREIRLRQNPNHVHLVLSRTNKNAAFGYDEAIDVIMRFTPDIVLVGEISTRNAGALWKLTGTGHGAMLTTIHASTVEDCYDVLYERISANIPNLDRDKMIQKIRENFCVIQMSRDENGERVITDIMPPQPKALKPGEVAPLPPLTRLVEQAEAMLSDRSAQTALSAPVKGLPAPDRTH
jgi:type IV secretion system protein VirB11